MGDYILTLDQGTTSSRAIIFDSNGRMIAQKNKEFKQIYPKAGWIEHNAEEIWSSQFEVIQDVIKSSRISIGAIKAIGITNQRETVVVWNKNTGKPIYNAIVWQCRRTAPMCEVLKEKGLTDKIKDKTGLVIDAYFSGTKIAWILDNVPGARHLAENGELLAGTIDTWLIWKLTNGGVHATDYTNASRTMLFNIKELCWDRELMEEFNIPICIMPKALSSSGYFGVTDPSVVGGEIPITGVAGDQQSALFGQVCYKKGMAKNTYGTGCFLLMNIGDKPIYSKNNLLTTIAWGLNGKVQYAFEGSVFVAGAAIQWLRDELQIIDNAAESEKYALKVKDTNGVYVVPAFTGLGAPYWDMYARGAILGITRGVNKSHIIRATLESLAYQTRDVLEAMENDSGIKLKELRVDGGASANNFLMQFQSDILGVSVVRPDNIETTAMGAAFLAGLESGVWADINEITEIWQVNSQFETQFDINKRKDLYNGWKRAVSRCRGI